MTMKDLYERSGSTNRFGNFALTVRKVVKENRLPNYVLNIHKGQSGDEIVSMVPKPTTIRDRRRRNIKLPN